MRSLILNLSAAILIFVLSSCDKLFEYSPYSANVPEKAENTTSKNIKKIHEIENEDPGLLKYKIALISDSHTDYNDLDDLVEKINRDEKILFTVFCGDMTDGGMLAEFLIFHKFMNRLNRPYLTVIGNHDCLSNGEHIYTEMYGPENYTLNFKGSQFIFFNDVIWELDNREPDYLWLKDELWDAGLFKHNYVISHIPPCSDVITPFQAFSYNEIIAEKKVDISIHGHHHDNYYGPLFNDSLNYMIVGAIAKRGYYELTIEPDTFFVSRVNF